MVRYKGRDVLIAIDISLLIQLKPWSFFRMNLASGTGWRARVNRQDLAKLPVTLLEMLTIFGGFLIYFHLGQTFHQL